jgi:hypothetical protein
MLPFVILRIANDVVGIELIGLCIALNHLAAYCVQPLACRAYRLLWRGHWVMLCALGILQVGWMICFLAHSSWLFIAGYTLSGVGTSIFMQGSAFLKENLAPNRVRPGYALALRGLFWLTFLIGPL